jgi:hypothetical protein
MMAHLFVATVLVSLIPSSGIADVMELVNVDTTPLHGQAGYFAFDFLGGTPIENNTVRISNFTSDATLGALTPTGDAVGNLVPGPGALNDSQFFNEFLQAATFGTTISFTLDLTTNVASGGIPDAFALYLLDSTENPFATSDPTGADSLFLINIDGAALAPDVYVSSSATSTVTPSSPTAVPEPDSVVLLLIAIIPSLVLMRRRCAARQVLEHNRNTNIAF